MGGALPGSMAWLTRRKHLMNSISWTLAAAMMDNCQLVMYCLSRGGIAIPDTYHSDGSNHLTIVA
jgi:hypothetical protein